jgi:predicted dehydrogenase
MSAPCGPRRHKPFIVRSLGSHQVAIANWVFGDTPEAAIGSGGVHRFKDGREVEDHVDATFEYPGGRTAVFSTIESNAYDHYYEAIFGTKGTLILKRESEAFLFEESEGARTTSVEVEAIGSGPMAEASESRAADALGQPVTGGQRSRLTVSAYEREVSEFCAAVRTGRPLRCGPERALRSAASCLAAHAAVTSRSRVTLEI